MVLVREATTEEWQVLRDIRLTALQDAPGAFGSTYAEQAASKEADWRRRISRGGTFLSYIAEVNLDDSGAGRGWLLIVLCRVFRPWCLAGGFPAAAVLPMCSGAAPAPTAPGRAPFRSQGRDGWSGRLWQGAQPLPAG